MSALPARSLPEPITWHRHWIVLVRAIALPVGGILTLAVAPLLPGGIKGVWTQGVLVVGSLVLLSQALRLSRKPPQVEQTPLAQRQGVLRRVTQPVRWIMSLVASGLAALALLSVALSFASKSLQVLLVVTYVIWLFFILLWLVLNSVDWRNDIYVLTHDRIIDQVRFPLLYDQRTEARLDQVQNVRYQQGFWGGILGFGDVTVETAGRTQAVLFQQVPNPMEIQRWIFERIDQLNERRAQEDATKRQDQLTKWFSAYNTLTGRIEIISLPESTRFPRPIHVEWWINTQPTQSYKTWVAYDSVSLAEGQSHPETDPFESTGRRRVHQIIPATSRGDVYLKIWLRLLAPADSGQADEDLATRELTVRVE
jgi:membrane protein YdbS with pleckstrin-like domain